MNNLILALLLAGLYYVASGYSGVDSDTQEAFEGVERAPTKHALTSACGGLAVVGAIPACSLSFEDRQQLEEFLEGVE